MIRHHVFAVFALSGTTLVQAQTFFWDNHTSDHKWSDSVNWEGGVAPIAGGGPNVDLVFSSPGAIFDDPFNDLPGTFILNELTVNGTDMRISGNPLEFAGPNAKVLNIGGFATLLTPLKINDPLILEVLQPSGPPSDFLIINGALSGSADVTKSGIGRLSLLSSNGSWTGNLIINQGVVRLGMAGGNTLSNSTSIHIATGAEADFSGNDGEVFGGLTGAGLITIDSGIRFGANNQDASFAGTIVSAPAGSAVGHGGTGTWTFGPGGIAEDLGLLRSRGGGTLKIDGADVSATEIDAIESSTLTLQSGVLRTEEALFEAGDFQFLGGVFQVDVFNGTLENSGGVLTPGITPQFTEDSMIGVTRVTEDFTQGPTGAIAIEIEGFGAGIGHDLLSIPQGTATLAGTLEVSLAEEFLPQPGASFTVVSANSIVGTFDEVRVPTVEGITFEAFYDAASVRLEVVEAPLFTADFDQDGDVDDDDLTEWQANYGSGNGADADGDGDSDGDDFLVWQQLFGSSAGPPESTLVVPEPNAATLLLPLAAGYFFLRPGSSDGKRSRFLLLLGVVFFNPWQCRISYAQLFSWTGGGSTNNWSEAANWGGVVPTDGSADIFFPPNSSSHTSVNNLGTFDLELLFISGSTPYTISGNTLRFSATTPELTVSSGAHTINNPISITQPLEVQVNTGDSLELNGNLSGSADISKINSGLLVLDGNNGSWSGDLIIQAGTVRFDPGDVLSVNSDVHVAAGATADFSPQGEGFGGFSGMGHLEFGNTVDIFSHFASNKSFGGTASGANTHLRKQGPASLTLTSSAAVGVDRITVEDGAISVGAGATVTTTNTNVDLGASLLLAANSTYQSEAGMIVLGTLSTSGGEIKLGQFRNLTIREFGIWNLDDTGTEFTTFTEAILNVNDSAELRLFGDVTLDQSFLNIEDTDLLSINNTGVDIVAKNISSLIVGALTGEGDTNHLDLDKNSTIALESGSALRTNWIQIGFEDSQSAITLDGAGTLINAPYAVDVGFEGPGEMAITGGARVDSFFGAVGRNPGGSGLLTISGTDENDNPSTWVLESNLNIALSNSTSGEVHVLEGAELSADVLTVGAVGEGSLTVEESAVSSSNGILGNSSMSTGTVSIAGTESTWTISEELVVGDLGEGTLAISAGGHVSDTVGRIAFDTDSMGTVTVSGAGSTWTNSEFLQVGVSGNGELTIANGGAVSSSIGFLGANSGWTGRVIVTGPGSTWNTEGMVVGQEGEGTLTISNGGLLSSLGGSVGSSSGAIGNVVVTGAASMWSIDGEVTVGRSGRGTLIILKGGTVENGNAFIARSSNSTGIVNVSDLNTTWNINGQLSIGGNADLDLNGGNGALNIFSGAQVVITGDTTLFLGGVLRQEGGVLTTNRITFNGGGSFEWGSGTLHIDVYEGDLTNPSGGTLAPGQSAGSTTILGDYMQLGGGTLEIEIGGTSPGGTHDLVNITGDAVLDGDLALSLLEGFLPSPSDTFTVFNANGGILGVFDNISTGLRLDTKDGLGSFLVHYGIGSAFDPEQIVLSDFQGNFVLAADFDKDGDVDGDDLSIWQDAYGMSDEGDADADGDSDGEDFLVWQQQFGSGAGAAVEAVPEPATLVWGLAIMVMPILWRSKQA